MRRGSNGPALPGWPRGAPRPARRHARGFLLIEALVALVVLAITLAALLRTTTAALDDAGTAALRTGALELCLERASAFRLGLLPAAALPVRGSARLRGQEVQWVIEAGDGVLEVHVEAGETATRLASLTLPAP